MRRLFSVVALLLAMGMLAPVVTAQDATPEVAGGFADLGLPTLELTASATGINGFPEQLEAGRYLITLSADDDLEFGGGFDLIQPSGMTADEFNAMFGPGSEPDAGAVEGTPIAELIATPADEADEMGAPPPELHDATWAGGIYAAPGATSQVVLDITPGEWIVSTQDDSEPIVFEATGEMPADLPEPESNATFTMGEYVIAVTDGELTAGSQTVRIDNNGAQPHFIGWVQVPDGLTEEQIEVVLGEEMEAEMTGTPPVYSDFNPEEDTTEVTFTGNQSTGTSTWITVNIEAGTHVLICFFPDITDGLPHAYYGMYEIVEIAD